MTIQQLTFATQTIFDKLSYHYHPSVFLTNIFDDILIVHSFFTEYLYI